MDNKEFLDSMEKADILKYVSDNFSDSQILKYMAKRKEVFSILRKDLFKLEIGLDTDNPEFSDENGIDWLPVFIRYKENNVVAQFFDEENNNNIDHPFRFKA